MIEHLRATVVAGHDQDHRLGDDLAAVVGWLRDTVGRPSPHIGREGAVCPFVGAALDSGSVSFHFHYGVNGRDPDQVRALVTDEVRAFRADAARRRGRLDSHLIVLPDADRDGCATIDALYAELKDLTVAQGLMVGQFHPDCDERAVRNPAYPVSRSPVPLIVTRSIARHDVLFLHAERRWFDAYRARHRPGGGASGDLLARELYEAAVREYGPSPGSEPEPGQGARSRQ